MARKAVLKGGKRDEIIHAASQLFFKHGYEATSVRMILDKVNGEVGMFYHYFKSKDELFQAVVEQFFINYRNQFTQIVKECDTKEQFIESLIMHFEGGMKEFSSISDNLHWTIQYALVAKTIEEMKPAVIEMLSKWEYKRQVPTDIVANQLLLGISATVHSESYGVMSTAEKREILLDLVSRLLDLEI